MTTEPSPVKPATVATAAAAVPATVRPPARPRTPEAAFDALYVRAAPGLLHQVRLLTGRPGFARHCVRRAFDLAWQRWPEVARDSDPVGWVRAAAYEYALAPWHRWVPARGPRPRGFNGFSRFGSSSEPSGSGGPDRPSGSGESGRSGRSVGSSGSGGPDRPSRPGGSDRSGGSGGSGGSSEPSGSDGSDRPGEPSGSSESD